MNGDPTAAQHGTSAILTAALELTEQPPQHFDLAYTAVTQACPWPKAYGGDMVGAAAAAAMRSVTDGKTMHSIHSYFMRPVDIGAEVVYEVELLRDGRGYSTRQVRAYQNDKVVYVCLVGFAAGDAQAADFGPPAPLDVPDPESLPSSADYLANFEPDGSTMMTAESKAYWSGGRSFDMRHVPGPVYLSIEGPAEPHQALWVKPFDPLRSVPGLSDEQRDLAALAYACDYTILEPILRMLDRPWAQHGLVTASLDHAMWFHRPLENALNGWLLYTQDAESAADGRGLGRGRFFTPDGRHLATVLQEGMIRPQTGAR